MKRSGFWNQRYTVYTHNKEVLSVSHSFWGSKGKIQFADGTQYKSDYNYRNTLTLRFLDNEKEILSYCVGKEHETQQAILSLGITLIDAEKLLILAALGMVIFLNIFNEFNEDESNLMIMLTASA